MDASQYHVRKCGLLLLHVINRVACLTVTAVRPAKTAEPIEMPSGGPRNHVLDGVQMHAPTGRGTFRGVFGPLQTAKHMDFGCWVKD